MRGPRLHGLVGAACRSVGEPARELAVVGVLAALLVVGSRSSGVRDGLPLAQTSVVLAFAAGACAVAAAVLAGIVHRLASDERAPWIGAALALYGVVAVPATAVGAAFESGEAAMGAARLSAHALVVAMLLAAVRPPIRFRFSAPPSLFALGLLGTSAMVLLASVAPGPAQLVTSFAPLRFTVVGVWALAGVGLVWVVGRARSPAWARIGIGVAVMAFAHAYRVDSEPAQPIVQPGLTFSSVRLLGVVVVLLGLVALTRQTLRRVGQDRAEHQEELRAARAGLDRVAERDHELRNGLAGLAGVTYLIGGSPSADESRELRTAMGAELARLDSILHPSSSGDGHQGSDQAYPIGPVLRDFVVLRRGTGMDIRYDAETSLWAEGTPDVLTQVLTNVVTNCARHAPGSPVRVQACRRGDRIRVRVSDSGPGVAGGAERAVFGRGTRGAASRGQGLGLHICREALAAEGASIEIRPAGTDRPGCTVVIELRAATQTAGPNQLSRRFESSLTAPVSGAVRTGDPWASRY